MEDVDRGYVSGKVRNKLSRFLKSAKIKELNALNGCSVQTVTTPGGCSTCALWLPVERSLNNEGVVSHCILARLVDDHHGMHFCSCDGRQFKLNPFNENDIPSLYLAVVEMIATLKLEGRW